MKTYSDYRPVYILPVLAKVVEKATLKRIRDFFTTHDLLHDHQYGFQKGLNTSTAAVDLVRNILKKVEKQEKISLSLFDLSKAFDLVPHDILISKLKYYGFEDVALTFINDYLEGWHQVVEYNGTHSSPVRITRGVKQGSILGPMLFIIYINDLPHHLENSSISGYLFADDITICSESLPNLDHQNNIARATTIVNNWCSSNGLKLNKDKTQTLHLNLSGAITNSVNFLGIAIDNRLSWKFHITELAKKLSICVFMLRRLSSATTNEILRMVYFACFYSRMSYCILAWGASSHLEVIFKIQKSAIRILCGLDFRQSCRGMFRRVGTLTLPSLYILTMLTYVRNKVPILITRGETHSHNTRGQNKLCIDRCRLSTTQKLDPDQIGCRMFNSLPIRLKNLPPKQFKSRLKMILVEQELYSLDEYWTMDFPNI